ncbi:B12-binding domain-containing radical SAM protein [Candidatus Omnitrophota bacterium]
MIDAMRDILLVQLPPWGIDSPPLGVACIAAYMKKKGYTVDVYDLNIKLYSESHDQSMWAFERKDEWRDQTKLRITIANMERPLQSFFTHLKKQKYCIVGFSITQNSLIFAGYLSHEIKKIDSEIYLMAGGMGCWHQHERAQLAQISSIDAFAVGEGEELLEEVICAFRKNTGIEEIEGLVVRECITSNPVVPRYLSKNLDEYPAPTYEGFPLSCYIYPVFSMITSRGCVRRCEFCNDHVYQGKYRGRHYSFVIDEIKKHYETYGITMFSFNDSLINADLQNLRALCREIKKLDFSITWVTQSVIRNDMTIDDYVNMHEAGCKRLQFGIESGSDYILEKMKKSFTVKEAENVLRILHDIGIEAGVNIIVGFPGETENAFQETLDFLKRNRPYISRIVSANTCNVVYGSSLMKNHVLYGITLSDNKELMEVSWVGNDGNCDSLRKNRLQKVLDLASELSLPIGQNNIFVELK